MSVIENEVYFYGSANMPEDEVSLVGGAVDMSKLIFFNDITPNGLMDYVSSSASDTATVLTTTGRDAAGVLQSEPKTLTGTTVVNGSQTYERIEKVVQSGTAQVGEVAAISHTKVLSGRTAQGGSAAVGSVAPYIQLQSGDGGTVLVGHIVRMINNSPAGVNFQLRRVIRLSGDFAYVNKAWATVPTSASTYDVHQGCLLEVTPNRIVQVRRPFYGAAADAPGGSTRTFYEKVFAVNNDTVTTLTASVISKQADPSAGTLNIGVCKALNDGATAPNRQTTPLNGDASAITFTAGASPQSQNVPSPQNLPAGAAPNAAGAEGVWLQLVLTAGLAATKTTFDLRAAGVTT